VDSNTNGSATPGDNTLGYIDGDIVLFSTPVIRCVGDGANYITALLAYLQIKIAANTPSTAVIVVEVQSFGFEVIQDKSKIATLVAGTVTIADASITQTSKVKTFRRRSAGTAGQVKEVSRIAGTSITITSTNAADTSTIGYIVD
jgi:hypothetical protein